MNQSVFDRQIQEDKTSNATFASSDDSGNMISLAARYPSAAERQQLVAWVNALPPRSDGSYHPQLDHCPGSRQYARQLHRGGGGRQGIAES